MKKTWKKVVAAVLTVALSAGTFATFNDKTVSAAENATTTTDKVQVTGASIRFISENTAVDGIRFAVTVKNADFESVKVQGWKLLVMPTALVTGELDKDESYSYGENKTAKPVSVDIDWNNAKSEGDGKVVRIYLNEIDSNYYTTEITARAYCESGETVTYSNELKRSYSSVAEAALDDVKTTGEAGYENQVGSKYSPYDATQRDALLGVKYEKTGTWDYVDGNLVTKKTDTNSLILDRKAATTSNSYIIETSMRVGYDDNSKYTESETQLDNSNKGIVFGYNEETGAYYVLDIRYRVHPTLGRGFWAHMRYYKGNNDWDANVLSDTVAIEPGMYDFRITVDAATEGETVVYVECKEQGTDNYRTLIPSTANPNTTWKNNRTIVGTRVGLKNDSEEKVVFGSDIKVYNGGVQARNETLPVNTTLNITEKETTIEGSFTYDYRTELCTNVRREGILLGDSSKTGYFFCICDHAGQSAFFVSLKKGSDGTWGDVVAGRGFNDLPKRALVTEKGLTLEDNDEILVTYKIVVKKNTSNQNVFVIDYSLKSGDTTIYTKTGWECVDTNAEQITITNLYLRSEDGGSSVKDEKVNNHSCGDGKTVYYPLTINGKLVEPGKPSADTDTSTVTIRNRGTVAVDKTLDITNDETTIEGSFVYDYRTELCTNVRREGILLGDSSKTGYFFCICDHAGQSAFFVSLKKGSDGTWGDVVTGKGFNDLPKRALVTEKGLTLEDNDEILVTYKIVVKKNASNQNVFVIDYSLKSGDTTIYTKTGWECVDTNAEQVTITNLYLHSEDSGSSVKDEKVNGHSCGDGKTVYYRITINGEAVTVKQ